jgi:hypothetical protein
VLVMALDVGKCFSMFRGIICANRSRGRGLDGTYAYEGSCSTLSGLSVVA